MWNWKLLFALMAVCRSVYGSSIVKRWPLHIDFRVTFEIADSQTKGEGIAYLMAGLSQLLPLGEQKVIVCCIWRKGNYYYKYSLKSNVSADDIQVAVENFLRYPSSVGGDCTRRKFAHYGEVSVKTIAPEGKDENQWMMHVGRKAEEEAKNFTGLAIVFLHDYHLSRQNDSVWMVVQFSDPTNRKGRAAGDWQEAARIVVIEIWNASNSVFRECNYSRNWSSCYFPGKERDQCLREELIEPIDKQRWSPPAQKYCNDMPYANNESCRDISECKDTCSDILENMSCPCGGIGIKTLPKRFEHCPITSIPCTPEPCSSSLSTSTSSSWSTSSSLASASPSPFSLGALLLITGSAMFVLSGIGLIVFWCACVKRSGKAGRSTNSKQKRRR